MTTADGVRLFVGRPAVPPGARCTVVLLHGFLNSSRSPAIHAFARLLATRVAVLVPDLRGHGASGGRATMGLQEPLDVAAVTAAAPPGLPVVTVGVSLGAAAALLHAGTFGGIAGVVAISAPAFFMRADGEGSRRVLRFVTARSGRLAAAAFLRTRIRLPGPGDTVDAEGVLARIAPAFTVVVHDPADHFFDGSHAEHLYAHAAEPKELWWYPGAGHGHDLLTPPLADRILGLLDDRLGRS